MQLTCLPEEISRIHHCDEVGKRIGGCDDRGLLELPAFSVQPTFDLAAQLELYSGKTATVLNLLEDLAQAARKERPAPQFRYILGDPQDFVLSQEEPGLD